MKTYTDAWGVKRVPTVDHLSFYALRCQAMFFHPWDGPVDQYAARDVPNAITVVQHCACGRQRQRTLNNRTGMPVSAPNYSGGEMPQEPCDRRIAFLLFLRAQREALTA